MQRTYHEQRISELEDSVRQASQRWGRLSWVRGVAFLLALTLLILGFAELWQIRSGWFWGAGVVFLGFLFVVYVHEGIESDLRDRRVWIRLHKNAVARLRRDWAALPVVDVGLPPECANYSNDLDLFGRASLFQLLGEIRTPLAIALARDWILGSPPLDEIRARQEAVHELRGDAGFSEQLAFQCVKLSGDNDEPNRLMDWAATERLFDRRGILVWIARVLAVAMAGTLGATLAGWVPLPISGPILIALITVNFLLTVVFAARIHTQFNQVSARHGEIRQYERTYQHLLDHPAKSRRLQSLQNVLRGDDHHVLEAKNSLGRITGLADMRRGTMFILWLFLQFLFLWDFHVMDLLERWKARYGKSVRDWLGALAEWEVLNALGRFARDHDSWTTPEFVDPANSERRLTARRLGHPLLELDEAVCNDVEIGPAGTVLLVTGSNMSGKSTLLRAIGTNVVLGQLGAPVFARTMTLLPLRIETSMRIQDSLEDGVSFFMAELKRLKQIVDIAHDYRDRTDGVVLFLLDEILQGTNSRERHIAVARVIRHLIENRAIGAVSTHDLELANAPLLKDSCRPIHFRESFETTDGQRRMAFDYQAREGIATTTNALELLKLVGLDDSPS